MLTAMRLDALVFLPQSQPYPNPSDYLCLCMMYVFVCVCVCVFKGLVSGASLGLNWDGISADRK